MLDDDNPQWAAPEPRVWTCYNLSPIDHAWNMLPTVEETAQKLALNKVECFSANTFLSNFEMAKDLARPRFWEGDFVGEPRVFFLPCEEERSFLYAFAWAQRNNGTAFIVSPIPLPWLDA